MRERKNTLTTGVARTNSDVRTHTNKGCVGGRTCRPPSYLLSNSRKSGVRRELVPGWIGGARRTLCAYEELAHNGLASRAAKPEVSFEFGGRTRPPVRFFYVQG
jgi:hypothetical protein